MMKSVSLKKIGTPVVTRIAGLLVLSALAIAFFALPLASFAKMGGGCGGQKAVQESFKTAVQGVVLNADGSVKSFLKSNAPLKPGSWIVTEDSKQMLWAATLVKVNGTTGSGLTAPDGMPDTKSTPLKITNLP